MEKAITKICTKCRIEKSLDRFSVDKGLHGRRSQCRDCRNAHMATIRTPAINRKKRLKVLKNKPLYSIWIQMRARCERLSRPDYVRYGGRGIKVCERWGDYNNFEADMLSSYRKGLSLDRVNNDGDYSPENCRWATAFEQANNKRTSRKVTFNGMSMGISEWARYLGIKESTLGMRLGAYGWSAEKALTTI